MSGKELSNVEKLAVELGWNPDHDESSGRKFVSADEFIRRSREIQNTQTDQIRELQSTNKELINGMKEIKKMYGTMNKAEINRVDTQIDDLTAKRDQAVKDGDTETFNKADKMLKDLSQQKLEMESSLPKDDGGKGADDRTGQPQLSETARSWMAKNPWYGQDAEMTRYIDIQCEKYKGLPDDRYFGKLSELAQDAFPDKFDEGGHRRSPVEGGHRAGGDTGGKRKKKFTVNDLSDDQKHWGRFFEKQGVMTMDEYIQEQAELGNIG
jgi:hypothetical protein